MFAKGGIPAIWASIAQTVTTDIACGRVGIRRFTKVPVRVDYADGIQIGNIEVKQIEIRAAELLRGRYRDAVVLLKITRIDVHRVMEFRDVDFRVILVGAVAIVKHVVVVVEGIEIGPGIYGVVRILLQNDVRCVEEPGIVLVPYDGDPFPIITVARVLQRY